ncbi:hypothetical protein HETIRDRAFT_408734 [Heterobasidion irregulare TC 32-1]|uniref:Uncharacterized protein n=1 Tax=Heterobasidion irregulare (strain TC 32-1) TaxID=747525 RepID=W4KGC8_HETIT|nr:uncharacterized protein HETIRDRAFT_408734 [Heterobasidion irregulare TC 32-1]ETW84892.1 hypothetical protein HETIRDRAFT_408734 [Heterobasidion irregulare TC 32-1]
MRWGWGRGLSRMMWRWRRGWRRSCITGVRALWRRERRRRRRSYISRMMQRWRRQRRRRRTSRSLSKRLVNIAGDQVASHEGSAIEVKLAAGQGSGHRSGTHDASCRKHAGEGDESHQSEHVDKV